MAIFAHFIVIMSEMVKATAALLCLSEAFVSLFWNLVFILLQRQGDCLILQLQHCHMFLYLHFETMF